VIPVLARSESPACNRRLGTGGQIGCTPTATTAADRRPARTPLRRAPASW
jgi:hypothetical protein